MDTVLHHRKSGSGHCPSQEAATASWWIVSFARDFQASCMADLVLHQRLPQYYTLSFTRQSQQVVDTVFHQRLTGSRHCPSTKSPGSGHFPSPVSATTTLSLNSDRQEQTMSFSRDSQIVDTVLHQRWPDSGLTGQCTVSYNRDSQSKTHKKTHDSLVIEEHMHGNAELIQFGIWQKLVDPRIYCFKKNKDSRQFYSSRK